MSHFSYFTHYENDKEFYWYLGRGGGAGISYFTPGKAISRNTTIILT